jgi:small GTP-binding protein
MAFVNFATREITAKIVYYGPGLGGKTTSLQFIHNNLAPENRGKMISLATEEDRTIYFDFLPLNLGKIQDFAVRVQLYTVPGQVRYNATRKLVLRGADGVVFVADSQKQKKIANIESYNNMEENLRELGKDLKELPHILQFNKIDLPGVMNSEELSHLLNKHNVPFFETVATTGIGVLDALKSVTKLVFNDLSKKALLQKKTKTAASASAAQYTVASSFVEKPQAAAAVVTPPPVVVRPPEPPAEELYAAKPDFSAEIVQEDLLERPAEPEPYGEIVLDESAEVETGSHEEDVLAGSISPAMDLHDSIQEVEPIAEFDEAPEGFAHGIPAAVIDRESAPRMPATAAEKPRFVFGYKPFFQDSSVRFSAHMEALESHMALDQLSEALDSAKDAYACLLSELFPKEHLLDGGEAFRALALGLSLKRFLRFKQFLASQEVDRPRLLFVHHVLCELYLNLKEL